MALVSVLSLASVVPKDFGSIIKHGLTKADNL